MEGPNASTTLNRHRSPIGSCIVNRQIGSGNSNMESSTTPYLQVTWPREILDQKSAKKVIKALTMAMLAC